MSGPSIYGLEALYRLQDVEGRIRDIHFLAEQSEEKQRVTKCRHALETVLERHRVVQNRLQQVEKKLRRLELDIASLEADIAKHERQMFDGTVQDARGLVNIQERVNADRHRKDRYEEEALQVMDQIDQLRQLISKLDAEVRRFERAYATAKKKLDEAREMWRKQISELDDERNQLIDRISSDLLSMYKSLSKKMSRPVAQVESGTCRGCNVTLPTSMKRPCADEILRCPQCARLLWWPATGSPV